MTPFPLSGALGIRHDWIPPIEDAPLAVTSGRHGGVSRPPYATLNLGLHVHDDPTAVRENRRRFLAAWGIPCDRLVIPNQTHTANVARVFDDDIAEGRTFPNTDALVSDCQNVALGVLVADCVPVFLYDPAHRAVGMAHAGWRGTFDGVVAATVRRMKEEFGTHPNDLSVILGPAIGRCCYEVSAELADRFRRRFGEDVADGRHLSLWKAIRTELEREGVPSSRVVTTELCTACNTDYFFSHRREGAPTGRMLACVYLR